MSRARPPTQSSFSPTSRAAGRSLAEVVLHAASVGETEREAYLERIATDDPTLARAARRRLAAAQELPSSFLESPAAERLEGAGEAERSAGEGSPPPAERYQLGPCLGQGGMGRVVEAYDRLLERRVALKFLTSEKPGIRDLFLREGRAQARVRHEHVLEIYDGGELDGQPFLSMRHVAGGSLATVAPSLSLEQRVRLSIQVAEGLHAAHREGLLHRDVKPSNVLVEETPDGDLTAYVSDFGIAADVTDPDRLAGDAVAGSPYYIAPERLDGSGGVDRRSDVYSLGVTMYWLLTGSLPLSGQPTLDILLQTVRGGLPPPRRESPNLPAELDAIVQRCVARDPDARYASARAVAEDLQRFLDGEVVEAYAAGLAYRLTRFVLRHRLLVGAAAVAATALVVAGVAVAVFAVRADAARTRAELRQGQAEELIRFMVVDLQKKLEPASRLAVLDDVGRAAMEYFAAVPEEELSEEELLRRSRMLYQLGNLRIQRGELAEAAAPMAESLALTRRLHELAPTDPERLFELGQSSFWVGFVAWERGDLEAARGPMEEYLAISRRLVGMDPEKLDWQLELGYAHSNLGSVLQAGEKLAPALEEFRASLAIKERLVAADPSSRPWRTELAAGHNTVGVVLQALGRLAEARERFEAERGILTALVEEDPTDLRARDFLATSHGYLGRLYQAVGEPARAEQELASARTLLAKLVEHDPENTQRRYKLVLNHLDLGWSAFVGKDLATAQAEWLQAQRHLEALLAIDDSTYDWRKTQAVLVYHLALLQAARGEEELARKTVLQAIEGLAGLAETQPADRSVHLPLARSYLLLGSLERSPAAAHAAFGRAAEHLEPFARDGRDARILAPWASALRCLGRLEEARAVDEVLRSSGYVQELPREPCAMPSAAGS